MGNLLISRTPAEDPTRCSTPAGASRSGSRSAVAWIRGLQLPSQLAIAVVLAFVGFAVGAVFGRADGDPINEVRANQVVMIESLDEIEDALPENALLSDQLGPR